MRLDLERRPDRGAVDAEGLSEVGDGDHDAPTETNALEVARPHELVGGRAADAEDLAGLLDREGEGMVVAHVGVGRETAAIPRRNPCRPGSPVRAVHHRG